MKNVLLLAVIMLTNLCVVTNLFAADCANLSVATACKSAPGCGWEFVTATTGTCEACQAGTYSNGDNVAVMGPDGSIISPPTAGDSACISCSSVLNNGKGNYWTESDAGVEKTGCKRDCSSDLAEKNAKQVGGVWSIKGFGGLGYGDTSKVAFPNVCNDIFELTCYNSDNYCSGYMPLMGADKIARDCQAYQIACTADELKQANAKSGIRIWSQGSYGKCLATECNDGYHLDVTKNNCNGEIDAGGCLPNRHACSENGFLYNKEDQCYTSDYDARYNAVWVGIYGNVNWVATSKTTGYWDLSDCECRVDARDKPQGTGVWIFGNGTGFGTMQCKKVTTSDTDQSYIWSECTNNITSCIGEMCVSTPNGMCETPPTGYYADGSKGPKCQACLPGYCYAGGAQKCAATPANHYANDRTSTCYACSDIPETNGYYGYSTGGTGADKQEVCYAKCSEKVSAKQSAIGAAGKWSLKPGGKSQVSYGDGNCDTQMVLKCNAGYYFTGDNASVPTGDNRTCTKCPEYHNHSTADNTDGITKCYAECSEKAGSANTGTNTKRDHGTWDSNGKKYYSGDDNSNKCDLILTCDIGYYNNGASGNQQDCIPCPAGATTLSTGAASASECVMVGGDGGTQFCDKHGCFYLPNNVTIPFAG